MPARRSAGVGDVGPPQGVGRHGQAVQPRELGFALGVELQRHLTEQGRRPLAVVTLDLDRGPTEDRGQEGDPGRQPGESAVGQAPCLVPAPEEDERLGHVADEQIAERCVQADVARRSDTAEGDLDGLGAASIEIEDRGQVGRYPEDGLGIAEVLGCSLGVVEHLDRPLWIPSPGHRHGQRRRRVDLLGPRDGVARRRDLDGLAGEPLRLAEDAADHEQLGERGQRGRPVDRRLARDEVDGATGGGDGPDRVAGRAPDLGEPLRQPTGGEPLATRIERADRGLEVGGRA